MVDVDMKRLHDKVIESAEEIRGRMYMKPDIALILGTGLGGVADIIDTIEEIPYDVIPYFPLSTAQSHDAC